MSETRKAILRLQLFAIENGGPDAHAGVQALARDILMVTRDLDAAQPAVKALKRLVRLNNPTIEQHDRAWAAAEKAVKRLQTAAPPTDGPKGQDGQDRAEHPSSTSIQGSGDGREGGRS